MLSAKGTGRAARPPSSWTRPPGPVDLDPHRRRKPSLAGAPVADI